MIDDILGSKDLFLRIIELQLVQLELLSKSCRILFSAFSVLGCDPQSMKVIEGTTFCGVCAGRFRFETFSGDDKSRIDFTEFFFPGDKAC